MYHCNQDSKRTVLLHEGEIVVKPLDPSVLDRILARNFDVRNQSIAPVDKKSSIILPILEEEENEDENMLMLSHRSSQVRTHPDLISKIVTSTSNCNS